MYQPNWASPLMMPKISVHAGGGRCRGGGRLPPGQVETSALRGQCLIRRPLHGARSCLHTPVAGGVLAQMVGTISLLRCIANRVRDWRPPCISMLSWRRRFDFTFIFKHGISCVTGASASKKCKVVLRVDAGLVSKWTK